jgi:hypothetical protein
MSSAKDKKKLSLLLLANNLLLKKLLRRLDFMKTLAGHYEGENVMLYDV